MITTMQLRPFLNQNVIILHDDDGRTSRVHGLLTELTDSHVLVRNERGDSALILISSITKVRSCTAQKNDTGGD